MLSVRISPPYIPTGFFKMPVHRTVRHTHTIFSQNENLKTAFFFILWDFPKMNFLPFKFFKIRVKSVKNRLFSGGGCENSLCVQKDVRALTVWKSFPLPVFMGGVSKSFFFLSDTSHALYFVQKNPFIQKKNVFGQSFFGLICWGQLNFELSPDSANLRTPHFWRVLNFQ